MFGVAGAIVLGFRKEPFARLVSKSFCRPYRGLPRNVRSLQLCFEVYVAPLHGDRCKALI